MRKTLPVAALLLAFVIALPVLSLHAQQPTTAPSKGLSGILHYISDGWNTLTRSTTQCASVADPKLKSATVVYLPADFPLPASLKTLQAECKVSVEHLPKPINHLGEIDVRRIQPPGLLFLEKPYVVPGGRFNEMYGWDSYFIIRGLLRNGRTDLARNMVENFFFEIDHYGAVLNANRTYYLSRSQPPFLTSMILGVYESQKNAGKNARDWLERAYKYASKDYELWVREPHLAASTGLSRYYDLGEGPAPEEMHDDPGYYRNVTAYLLMHPETATRHLSEVKKPAAESDLLGPSYSLQLCGASENQHKPDCAQFGTLALTSEFYKGDRSMRESGFDVSFRFGAYGADTHHYAAVCLNSLLYKTEKDLEQMSSLLGHEADARQWRERAEKRQKAIHKFLWNEQRGMFFEYDFQSQKPSTYEYITTFYPLWAGLATAEQARAVARNVSRFEQPGGLLMSRQETGGQWDYPYGWAPTQLLAIEGLRRYGYNDDANRLSYEFLSTVLQNFQRDGTIREKYNVVTRSSEVHVTAGYQANVVGFGWTNGVFLALLHALPPDWVKRLEKQ
jgi:alpha,alpha-trehalase